MQYTDFSRSLFGRSRISLIGSALIVGMMLFAANGRAQQTEILHESPPTPKSQGIVEHAGTPINLRELVQEAEQKNPQIAAAYHGWQASRHAEKGWPSESGSASCRGTLPRGPRQSAGRSKSSVAVHENPSGDRAPPSRRRTARSTDQATPGAFSGVPRRYRREPRDTRFSVHLSRTVAARRRKEPRRARKTGIHSAAGKPSRVGTQEFPPRLQCSIHV